MQDFNLKHLFHTLTGLFLGMVVCALISILSGCKSIQYVDRVKTEYVSKTDSFTKYDSIYIDNYVKYYVRGDTIYKDSFKVVYKWSYLDRVKCDTVHKTDSIQVPVYIEHKKSSTEVFLERTGLASLVGLLVFAIVFIIRLKWKKG